MITRGLVVYKLEDGKLIPHDHPVFTGDIAYDIPNRGQEIATDPATDNRFFSSENEILAAVADYVRQEPDQVTIDPWVVVTTFSAQQGVVRQSKGKQTKTK